MSPVNYYELITGSSLVENGAVTELLAADLFCRHYYVYQNIMLLHSICILDHNYNPKTLVCLFKNTVHNYEYTCMCVCEYVQIRLFCQMENNMY